jgi:hypothetical protein
MDIVLDPMVFIVSYKDVVLLQEIAGKLTATPGGTTDESDSKPAPPTTSTGRITPTHGSSSKNNGPELMVPSSSTSSSSSSSTSSSSSSPPSAAPMAQPVEEELNICTGGIRFRFIDVLGDATPLAYLRFSRLSAKVRNWSSRVCEAETHDGVRMSPPDW